LNRARLTCGVLAATLVLAFPRAAKALDTLETFEPGGLNRFELAVGTAGLGRPTSERRVGVAYLLGMGITDGFSAYYAGSGRFTEDLDGGEDAQGVGLFGTVLDSYNLDLDLTLDLAIRSGRSCLVGPGFELNVDAHPDQSSFGLFVQGGPAAGGRLGNPDVILDPPSSFTIPLALGSYYAVADGHRVLMDLELSWLPTAKHGQQDFDRARLRIGYDVEAFDTTVLLSEAFLQLPRGEARAVTGFWLGIQANAR
jgi:hypothetical protein